jgi:hypothetical protein
MGVLPRIWGILMMRLFGGQIWAGRSWSLDGIRSVRVPLMTREEIRGASLMRKTDTPIKRHYSLTERPGYLRLYGNCYDLSSPEAPAMLLRKQTSYKGEAFRVRLDFNPRKSGYEAGLVLWWNQYSFATVGITAIEGRKTGSSKTVVFRAPTGQPGVMKVSHIRAGPSVLSRS